jgi:hypothetical protein
LPIESSILLIYVNAYKKYQPLDRCKRSLPNPGTWRDSRAGWPKRLARLRGLSDPSLKVLRLSEIWNWFFFNNSVGKSSTWVFNSHLRLWIKIWLNSWQNYCFDKSFKYHNSLLCLVAHSKINIENDLTFLLNTLTSSWWPNIRRWFDWKLFSPSPSCRQPADLST